MLLLRKFSNIRIYELRINLCTTMTETAHKTRVKSKKIHTNNEKQGLILKTLTVNNLEFSFDCHCHQSVYGQNMDKKIYRYTYNELTQRHIRAMKYESALSSIYPFFKTIEHSEFEFVAIHIHPKVFFAYCSTPNFVLLSDGSNRYIQVYICIYIT